jgi:hypothetical protein
MRRWAGRAATPESVPAEDEAAKPSLAVILARAAKDAKAAVAVVDREVTGQVRRALEDLGLAGDYPAVVADVIVQSWVGAYHTTAAASTAGTGEDGGVGEAAAAEAGAEKNFDTFLDFIAGAAEGAEVAAAPGEAPAEVLLYLLARGLSEEGRRELLAQARQFTTRQDQHDAAEDMPDGGLQIGMS